MNEIEKEQLARELYRFLSHVDLMDSELGTREGKEAFVWQYINLKYPD